MSEYRLKIVTPDRLVYDSLAERLVARTTTGDVCILARHTEYITPLAIGMVKVKANGEWRIASCSGGTLVVSGGDATIIADAFEWSDEIDLERAEAAKEKAEKLGIKTVICTDISRDGAMNGTNLERYKELSEKFSIDIIASGGVTDMTDVENLAKMNIYGAILGKAIYTGNIDLKTAIKAATK